MSHIPLDNRYMNSNPYSHGYQQGYTQGVRNAFTYLYEQLYNMEKEASILSKNESEFFVPGNITGEEYTNLFVKELKEFGFNENDLHLEVIKCKEYDLYTITVRW